MKNYYELLGLTPSATHEEVKQAYRLLAQKLHPDKNESNKFFDEMFKNINEAYTTLSDSSKRKVYDSKLFADGIGNKEKETIEYDGLCYDAIALVLLHKQASAAVIQRKLLIGYNRAGRIIDQLESLGIIGKFLGNAPREVLVDKIGAINLLTKKVSNFSKIQFIERYNQYENKLNSASTSNNSGQSYSSKSNISESKYVSIWNEVKTAKQVRNFIGLVDIILLLCLLASPKTSRESISPHDNTASTNTNTTTSTGRIKSYSGLNIRNEANSMATVLGSVSYNEIVEIIDKDGPNETISGQTANWIKIDYNGTTGWVWSGYVEEKD